MERANARRLCLATVCAALLIGVASPSLTGQENSNEKSGGTPNRANAAAVADVRLELAESSEAMVQAAADLRYAQQSLKQARRRQPWPQSSS